MSDKSDQRVDKAEERADTQALSLSARIGELVAGVKELVAIMEGLRRAEHRRNILLSAAAVLVFAFGVAFLFNFQKSFDNQGDLQSTLRIIVAVTGCTTEHTPKECKTHFQKTQRKEGRDRVAAVACLLRSVQAGDSEFVTMQKTEKCVPPETPKKPA